VRATLEDVGVLAETIPAVGLFDGKNQSASHIWGESVYHCPGLRLALVP
jgi:hypothetical protein